MSILKQLRQEGGKPALIFIGLLFFLHTCPAFCGACLTSEGKAMDHPYVSSQGRVCTYASPARACQAGGLNADPCCAKGRMAGSCTHSLGACSLRAQEEKALPSLDPDSSDPILLVSKSPDPLGRPPHIKRVLLLEPARRSGRSNPIFVLNRTFRF